MGGEQTGQSEIPSPYMEGFVRGIKKGEGSAGGTAMLELQRTLGVAPANEAELFRRQVLAQSIERLRQAIYNLLVFARAPTQMLTPNAISSQVEIESIAGDASSEPECHPDKRTPSENLPKSMMRSRSPLNFHSWLITWVAIMVV